MEIIKSKCEECGDSFEHVLEDTNLCFECTLKKELGEYHSR